MRRWIFTMVAVAGFSIAASAQTKAQLTAKIKTPGAGCEYCKKRIETYLKRYDGVMYINVNWRRHETTVKYLTDRTDIEQIKTAIANAGYDADDVPMNEDSYKRLPATCKLDENGEHPKPGRQ